MLASHDDWCSRRRGAHVVPNGLMSPTRNRLAAATDRKLQFPLRFPKVILLALLIAMLYPQHHDMRPTQIVQILAMLQWPDG